MTIYKHARLDGLTGEVEYIEFTPEEWEQYQAQQSQIIADQKAKEKEEAAKEAARQTALEKLAAFGLTPEEISAITGA
jgi:hypothetical protein